MKIRNSFLIIIVLTVLSASCVYASDIAAGTTGLQFLKIGIGARQAAMGEAVSAVSTDANAIFWNPAGIALLETPQAAFSSNQWLANVSQQSAAATYPTRFGTIGAGFTYLHMDDLTGYDIDTNGDPVKIPDFTSYDLAAVLSFARSFGDFTGGISLKLLQEKLENETASGIAVDIGAVKQLTMNLACGLAVQNIGPSVRFISDTMALPLTVRAGASYTLLNKDLLIAGDIKKPVDNTFIACLGAEYILGGTLAVRGGYISGDPMDSGLTAGLGMSIAGWRMDYAYVPYGGLGDAHRISIITSWGSPHSTGK